GEPYALGAELGEIRRLEARLENDRSAINAHTAGTEMLEAFEGGERQSLDAGGILGPAGNMDFRGADRGGDSAMHITFEEAHRALARRVVAEGDMNLRVDEAGDRNRPI